MTSATGGDVPVRAASTVMLLRGGGSGIEVFTLRRAAGMAFAAGMTAFPGGGSEPGDADPEVPWSGPPVSWHARLLGVPPPTARTQLVAAVRELFEETGVLLADGDGAGWAADADAREESRVAVAEHRIDMTSFLRRHDLAIRADLLRPWARWITPVGPPRRYDTYFFAAALPRGQEITTVTREASSVQWEQPAAVLRAAERGDVGLMPPTVAMLTDLAGAASCDEVLASERRVQAVTPEVISDDGEVMQVVAGGRRYSARLKGARGDGPTAGD